MQEIGTWSDWDNSVGDVLHGSPEREVDKDAVWLRDCGVGGLIVNHATAEEPGVRNLAGWPGTEFGLQTHFIPQGCLYHSVSVSSGGSA